MLTDQRGKTNNAMDDNTLALFIDAIEQLRKLAKKLRARYEWLCDNEPKTATEDGEDINVEQWQAQADKIAANVGLYVYHQTDCRGASIYVSFSPIPDNNYTHAA